MADVVIDLSRLDPKKPLPDELKKQIEGRMAESGYRYESIYTRDMESYIPKRLTVKQEEEEPYNPSDSILKKNLAAPIDIPRSKSRLKEYSWDMGHHDVGEETSKEVEKPRPASKTLSHSDRSPTFTDSRTYLTKKMTRMTRASKDPFYYADRIGSKTQNSPLVIRSRNSLMGELSEQDLQAGILQLSRLKKESTYSIVNRLKILMDGGKTANKISLDMLHEADDMDEKKHISFSSEIPGDRRISYEGEEDIDEEEMEEWTPEMETGYLNSLEVMALLTQIENGLDELAIIETLLPKDRGFEDETRKSIRAQDRLYKSPEERFGTESTRLPEEIENEGEAFLRKLHEVSTFASDVLNDTKEGLEENNSFWSLFLAVEDQKQMKKDEEKMEKMYSRWDEMIEEKQSAIQDTLEEHEEAIVRAEAEHLNLMDEMDSQHRSVDAQLRYVERWEKSRQEQHRIFISKMLQSTRQRLSDVNELIDHETTRFTQVKNMGEEPGRTPEDRIRRLMLKWEDLRTKDIDNLNRVILEEKYKLHGARRETKILDREVVEYLHGLHVIL